MNPKTEYSGGDPVANLSWFLGKPGTEALFKKHPEDFVVTEILGFEPEGKGEHLFLHIKKQNTNTDYIAKQIAKLCGLPRRDISYSGMKDRNAITTQWFSVWMRNKPEPDWRHLCSENVEILEAVRHRAKLRRGVHKFNGFEIILRELGPDNSKEEIEKRLQEIEKSGVPNYFGSQRFGYDGKNISDGLKFLNGEMTRVSKSMRGIYLSAIRSWVFNDILSERVAAGSWNQCIDGDVVLLEGSGSLFQSAGEDKQEMLRRVEEGDLHPTAVMPGKPTRHTVETTGAAAELEEAALKRFDTCVEGLVALDLEKDRRSLRMPVYQLEWQWLADDDLKLEFRLAKGGFATAVLRELVEFREPPRDYRK